MDSPPFKQVGNPVKGGVVCVADHASNRVPDDVDLGIAPELLDKHIAIDIGVHGVATHMARDHGIAAHLAEISRLVVDLHREEDHPAVVPPESDGHLVPGNAGINIEARLDRFHRPYHEGLAQWLDHADPKLIISLHSFTPKLETSDEARPWEVALLYNQDDRAARHAIRLFQDLGLVVGDNEPYSGRQLNATMNRHAEAHGRYYCALEVRQDLIMTNEDQLRWASTVADVMGRVALALD
ncbi:MAG: N-formylglutamate amidohydrolase [Erythrobacter sp.]